MSTFYGLCLFACGLPALAASFAALRIARRRDEAIVAGAGLLISAAAVAGAGLLLA